MNIEVRNGQGIHVSEQQKESWLANQAKTGKAEAQYQFAIFLLNKSYGPGNYSDLRASQQMSAIQHLRSASKKGYNPAQLKIAQLLLEGKIMPKDAATAIDLYTKSADKGYISACASLGQIYYEGEHVEQSYQKAIELWTKALDNRSKINKQHCSASEILESCWFLSLCYWKGLGVKKNKTEAVAILEKGYLFSRYNGRGSYYEKKITAQLAICYANGIGITKDIDKATKLAKISGSTKILENLSSHNNTETTYELGNQYYADGDATKAAELWKKAAQQGHREAQNKLKIMGVRGW